MTNEQKRMMMDNYLLGPDGGPLGEKREAGGKESAAREQGGAEAGEKPCGIGFLPENAIADALARERAGKAKPLGLKAKILAWTVSTALVGTVLFALPYHLNKKLIEEKGGEKCAAILDSALEAREQAEGADGAFSTRLKEQPGSVGSAEVKAYMEQKGVLEGNFADKIQQWRACVRMRERQRNAPAVIMKPMKEVAIPKPLPRARNNIPGGPVF